MSDDYRLAHTAPTDDGYSVRLDQLDAMMPDVYDDPEQYHGGDDAANMSAITTARRCPQSEVTVYRSMPTTSSTLNRGDWISLSEQYAAQSGMHPDDPARDLPVRRFTVLASQVWWDGNSLFEFGYDGPVQNPVDHRP